MRHNDSKGAALAEVRGFTIVELAVSSVILIGMAAMVTSLSVSGSNAQKYADRQNRVTEIAQDVMDDIRGELTSSVFLIQGDAVGNAYRNMLDLSGTKPSVSTKLPPLFPTGGFQKESSMLPRTGNGLCFAKHAWVAAYQAASGSIYQIDVYRLVYYYMTPEGGGPQAGVPWGLNLCKWVGEPMADGDEIDRLAPADQTSILAALHAGTPDSQGAVHPRVELVWLRGSDVRVTGSLRQILATGAMTSTPQSPRQSPWTFEREPSKSSDGMLFHRHHSVATNFAPSTLQIGKFGLVSNAGYGFPHGFEVQMIGPASARQVMLRLLLVSTNASGHSAHQDIQQVIDARDL